MTADATGNMDGRDQIPVAVIVGRPNVGKSSLLNALARRRISIVDPTSGVTRDRVSTLIEHEGVMFDLWDTGGLGVVDEQEIAAEVEAQIDIALHAADVVLFVVDVAGGFDESDHAIAGRLRRLERPLLLVANKVDGAAREPGLPELRRLGLGEPIPVSALHRTGCRGLLDRLCAALPERRRAAPPEAELRLAIVGCQNAGKSSLINRLARSKRVIVAEMPGTTRDAVDVRFEWEGSTFLAIDTAGLKRRIKKGSSIEFYSAHRAERSIRRADVVFLMIDATRDISRTDKRIAGYIEEQARPCAILINKWDLAGAVATGDYMKYLEAHLAGLAYAPVLFISALEGGNVEELLPLARELHQQASLRIGTGELNRAVREALDRRAPKVRAARSPRLLYTTQVGTCPPTFVVFVNDPSVFTAAWRRFLANFLRERFPFGEVPLRIYLRGRRQRRGPVDKQNSVC